MLKSLLEGLQAYKNQTKDQSNPLGRCPEQKKGKEYRKVRIMKEPINMFSQSRRQFSVCVIAFKIEEYLYLESFPSTL
jgi:hypothetical protein